MQTTERWFAWHPVRLSYHVNAFGEPDPKGRYISNIRGKWAWRRVVRRVETVFGGRHHWDINEPGFEMFTETN